MLSKKTKYAITALVFLGKNKELTSSQSFEIAEKNMIPKKFLEHILRSMRNHGFLYLKKGPSGGYRLNKHPQDIFLIDVLRFGEGPIAMVPCVSQKLYHKCEECMHETTCGIKDVFVDVHKAVLKILSETSIADIIQRENALAAGQDIDLI